MPKSWVKEAGRSYREHSGMGNPELPSQPRAQHRPGHPPAGVAAGEASPGWVPLLLQACAPHPHEQGCQPSPIPVPTPHGHFPPPKDHVDPSTPSTPSSDPLQLQRSQGGSWGGFYPSLPPEPSLEMGRRAGFDGWAVLQCLSSPSAGGGCLPLRLMHVLTPQGGRLLLPGHLHHQDTQTSGRWRCHLSLLARLLSSLFHHPPLNFIPIF